MFSLDLNGVAYPVDAKDSVAALAELPRPTAGAGEPVLFASEYTLQIAYYTYGRIRPPEDLIAHLPPLNWQRVSSCEDNSVFE